ncbi:MAG: tetratricopeptide repeat protein [Rhodocyclales bacterium]|nr:tetratricopeptide repeat protein [Rhodocyclales bacterium]
MIFISYRRSDTDDHAGRLIDRLRHWFDAEAIFYDKQRDSIDIGDTFPAGIDTALDRAAVVLVLIGPDWLAELNRRVDLPGIDYVRREVVGALRRGKRVIPILLGGATVPDPSDFHADLRAELTAFCNFDAHRFPARDGKLADYDHKFVQLRDKLAALPDVPKQRFRLPGGAEQPRRLIDHQISPHFRDPNALLPQLHAQLSESGSTGLVARTALYGMGGLGKTQLALKYSLDYPDHYAGIWWFRAETDTTLQLDAEECCKQVGAAIAQGETPSTALKRWLDRQAAPWLLVYDNAEDAEHLRPHLPQGNAHGIVVTSRAPAWGGLVKHAMELDVWTPGQGAAFLAERLPGRDLEALPGLAEDLGGLPLALEQAAGYIESTGIGVAAYRELLAGTDTEGLILDEGRAATGYERTVLATLSLAFDKLSPAAAQALRLLAYAAPEAFPARFLREAADVLPTELAAANDDLAWNRLVAELRGYGLATVSSLPVTEGIDDEPALHLHRLTQQALRARLAEPAHDGAALQAVLHSVCPRAARLPGNWQCYAALLPHIVHLDRFLDAGWLNSRRHSWLLDQVASYLQHGPALYADAAHWYRRALELDRADLGEEHPNTISSINNLASTLQAQGDLAGAQVLQESALAIQRRVLGEEHPDTLTSINNLAGTLQAQGDLAGARALQEQELATCRRVLGEEHPDTLTSINNLAGTIYAQGDLTGARALEESVLATRRHVLGEEHPDTLTSINNLAGTLQAQGDLAGARVLQESVLAIRRRILGDEHPATLSSMNNLASTLYAQGDLTGARVLEESVLATRRRVLGKKHPDTLTSINNLATTLQAQGDLAGARVLLEAAVAIRHRVLGGNHPDTVAGAWNLFTTLYQLDDADAAKELLQTWLLPLLEMPPDKLPADLKNVRDQLLDNRAGIARFTGVEFPARSS